MSKELIEIPIGEFYVTKKGKKYECVTNVECGDCAFNDNHRKCDRMICTSHKRMDNTNVAFIRRKDLE